MSFNNQNQLDEKPEKTGKNSLFSFLNPFHEKIENDELLVFTENFASLVKDNMSIVGSLETLSTKIKDKKLKEIVTTSIPEVKAGVPLHICFRKHIEVFGNTYCDLIELGEDSGRIEIVLERLSNLLGQNIELKNDLENTFSYASEVTIFAFCEIVFLMAFVVPPFSKLFGRVQKPYITELVIKLGFWFQDNVFNIFGVIIAIFLILYVIKLTKIGKYILDYLKLKIPIFGELIKKYYFIVYSRNFVTSFNSGINLVSSMRLSTELVNNLFLKKKFEKVSDCINDGMPIAESFRYNKFLSKKSMCIIENGEESGYIDGMFTELANLYEKESLNKDKKIMLMVRPVYFVIMSLICGTVVFAMILPLLSVIKALFLK